MRVPLDATDLAPYVTAATGKQVDGVVAFVAGGGQARLLKSLRVSHFKGQVVTQASLSITGNPAVDEGVLGGRGVPAADRPGGRYAAVPARHVGRRHFE